MKKEFTCIVCPNGCEITAKECGGSGLVLSGALCPKGESYVRQEISDPRRNIATSVRVRDGELPLASVRLTGTIPKKDIFRAMEEIRNLTLTAPVQAKTVILKHILGYESDVIVTKNIEKAEYN